MVLVKSPGSTGMQCIRTVGAKQSSRGTSYLDRNPPYYFQLLFAKEIISLKAQIVDGLGLR